MMLITCSTRGISGSTHKGQTHGSPNISIGQNQLMSNAFYGTTHWPGISSNTRYVNQSSIQILTVIHRSNRYISYLSAREELLACYNFVSWRKPESAVMRAVCHPAQGYPSLLTDHQVCYLFRRPDDLHEWSVETVLVRCDTAVLLIFLRAWI